MNKSLGDGFVRHVSVSTSQYDSLCREMAAEIMALRASVRNVLDGFESGVFCRDTSSDHEARWAIKAAPYLSSLAKLQTLVEP